MNDAESVSEILNRLDDFNLELFEVLTTTLDYMMKYCDQHGIPIRKDEALFNLIAYAKRINKAILDLEETIISRKSQFKEDGSPTDKRTEPRKK